MNKIEEKLLLKLYEKNPKKGLLLKLLNKLNNRLNLRLGTGKKRSIKHFKNVFNVNEEQAIKIKRDLEG